MAGNWGILGTGRIARTFAKALQESKHNTLVAVGSRTDESAAKFVAKFEGVTPHASYQALLIDPAVDTIYISTPHPQHVEWTIRALQAGKAVLGEKPLGVNHAEAMAMVDCAELTQRFLMEAFMYRLHPQTERLIALIRDGAIGEVRHVQASFGFQAPYEPTSRLFANALAGGGVMDVGCYPVSMVRLILGSEPISVDAHGHLGETGVDEWAATLLKFDNGTSAQIATAVSLTLDNGVSIYGTGGHIRVTRPWGPSDANGNWSFEMSRSGAKSETVAGQSDPIYVLEAEHVTECVQANRIESPLMSHADSLGNALALDAWRRAIGLEFEQERPSTHRGPLLGQVEKSPQPAMTYAAIDGLDKPVSRLVMGCDNQPNMSHAAVMWDAYFEAGGNAFDTAYIYGGGSTEKLLGYWHQQRGVRRELVIIGKGAHTPHNTPEQIAPQLLMSLERLQTDTIDIYFLHRDNPDVPVHEFIDALNEEVREGRIRVFGGSNWTWSRVQAANVYAKEQDLQGFSAISNNFSLARMIEPIWPGVESASEPDYRAFLEEHQLALMPWSSQARGFFTPWAERVIADTASENQIITSVQPTIRELRRTWFSEDNFERRRRAVALAADIGVEAIHIALAYVLQQPFPTFPVIGPRVLKETRSSMRALTIELTGEELDWLNLDL